MDVINSAASLALKARCELHKLIFSYLMDCPWSISSRKHKKKVKDASRKFFIENLNGMKTLRLKQNPSLKVHVNVEEVR